LIGFYRVHSGVSITNIRKSRPQSIGQTAFLGVFGRFERSLDGANVLIMCDKYQFGDALQEFILQAMEPRLMASRIPFMALAFFGLIAGLLAGLLRIGWDFPATPAAAHHGALMVGGFLSTLISLEKVIPLKQKILFIIPVLNALTALIIFPDLYDAGVVFMTAGSAGIIVLFGIYFWSQPRDRAIQVMLAGSILLLVGNVMLLVHRFYPSAILWWIGFVLFIITAERMELSKFLPVHPRVKQLLIFLLLLFPLGIILPHHGFGKYISGAALAGIAIWMLYNDVIMISIRKDGLARFSAVALLLGNIALLLAGIFLALFDNQLYAYDSFVHTFFIGFVMSMIFAHGPIILPGVLGIVVKPYHRILYVWLLILFGSLLLRLSGNMFMDLELRRVSGLLSALCILFYFITLATVLIRKYREKSQ